MFWIILSLLGAILYAITTFIDNYVADVLFRNKTPQAVKIINCFSYLALALTLYIVFRPAPIAAQPAFLLVLSGAIASLSSISYYHALKHEEATGAGIYFQLQPLFYLAVEFFLFHKAVSWEQLVALALIMTAPMLIIFSGQKSTRKNSLYVAFLFSLNVLLLTISGIISTHASEGINYISMYIAFLIGRGLSDLLLSAGFKSWRQRLKTVYKHHPRELIISVFSAQAFNISADFITRVALIIGSPAIVAALCNSAELIFIFIFGIIFTLIWPKFGREKLNRRKILAHLIGVILCVIGICILQFA